MPPEKSADQFLQKIAQQKAILIFSAILAKRAYRNLDLDIDLHGYKVKKIALLMFPAFFFVLMLYTRT